MMKDEMVEVTNIKANTLIPIIEKYYLLGKIVIFGEYRAYHNINDKIE